MVFSPRACAKSLLLLFIVTLSAAEISANAAGQSACGQLGVNCSHPTTSAGRPYDPQAAAEARREARERAERIRLANAYRQNEAGNAYYQRGDYKNAVKYYKKARGNSPNDGVIANNLQNALAMLNQQKAQKKNAKLAAAQEKTAAKRAAQQQKLAEKQAAKNALVARRQAEAEQRMEAKLATQKHNETTVAENTPGGNTATSSAAKNAETTPQPGSATAGSGASTGLAPMTPSGGISGLPGIFLEPIEPQQAPTAAEAALSVKGPHAAECEAKALNAAQQNPELTAKSDDPFVQSFQQQNKDYQAAVAANQEAEQKSTAAQARVEADKAALNQAEEQLKSATNASTEVKQQYQQLLATTATDEALATKAREQFDGTSVTLQTKRDVATLTLAVLAPAPKPAAVESTTSAREPQASTTETQATTSTTTVQPHPGRPASSGSGSAQTNLARSGKLHTQNSPESASTGAAPESLAMCLARVNPSRATPTLAELDEKIEGTRKALEQLAHSRETADGLNEQWADVLKTANGDLAEKSMDAILDGTLGLTKTALENEGERLKEPFAAAWQNTLELRSEHDAIAGSGHLNADVTQQIADYKERAQSLVDARDALIEKAEDIDHFHEVLEKMQTGKEWGEWLLGDDPCKHESGLRFNCENILKNNGVTQSVNGNRETQMDLLKMTLDFAKDNKKLLAAMHLAEHGNLIVDTWDATSNTIDLSFDFLSIYLYRAEMQRENQTNAKLAQARAVLNRRLEQLSAQISCYQNSSTGTSIAAAR